MCGVVDGGITAGLWGYEAGQSGVGDIFGWFVTTQVPHAYAAESAERGISVHELLTEKAATQAIGEHGLVALDWHLGNRSVLVNHELSGLVLGQTLATRPEDTYRALLESTAFGTRMIVETFQSSGIPVTELVVAGGLLKNELLMQIYADVLDLPLSTIDSAQGPALGSAIHAAVAAGAYPDVATAAHAMGRVNRGVFQPVRGQRRGVRRAVRRVPRAPRPLRPGRQRRDAAPEGHPQKGTATGGGPMTRTMHNTDRRPACPGRRPARRADPQQPRRLDGGQRLRPRPRRGPDGDQAQSASPTTTSRPTRWSCATSTATVVEGDRDRQPSSDAAAHAYVYRHMPEVGGAVHTHSTYATAWAARGEAIPCVLTMIADEFGGEIPVGPFALIGDDSIGRGIVETLRGSRSKAVLMRNHGPFTIGKDARSAVKAAVMVEDVARTVHIARQLGRAGRHGPGRRRLALRPLPERLRPARSLSR